VLIPLAARFVTSDSICRSIEVFQLELTSAVVNAVINAISALWWVFALAGLVAVMRLPVVKGWIGEAAVRVTGSLFLDSWIYRAFHDVTVIDRHGTTQIDHVLISPYGVFVIETKNMKGWIFGSERQAQWTQKIYRRSIRFQNPLRQNYRHTQALKELLQIPAEAVKSLVVFVGDCKLKTDMPANVVRGTGYIRYIKRFRQRIFSEEEFNKICDRLAEGRLEMSSAMRRQPAEQARQRGVRRQKTGYRESE
jgi:hypothetical protein